MPTNISCSKSKNNKSGLQPACLCCLRPAGHLQSSALDLVESQITATFTPAAFFSLSVLRSGLPRQSEPGPQDLPVGRVQPGDIPPRGSGHHRERRGQPGPQERPAEVHGDVPHGFLPAD